MLVGTNLPSIFMAISESPLIFQIANLGVLTHPLFNLTKIKKWQKTYTFVFLLDFTTLVVVGGLLYE